MTGNLFRRLLLASLACSVVCVPSAAQRGGGGKKGGDPTEIFRPVVISYPGSIGGGSAARYPDPDPAWTTEIDGRYEYYHPDQMQPDGGGRALVRAVSARGDLTHGGATRFVIDVREASDGSQALISTVETVGTPENPTWYYDGPGGDDEANDHVLLTDAEYVVLRARWSRDGARVAFHGTDVASGQSGVFVGDVVLDGAGEPDALANVVLVASGGRFPSWGGRDRIAFARNSGDNGGFHVSGGDGHVIDLSVTPPVETALGPTTSPPELSSDGSAVVYGKDLGSRYDLFVRDLSTGIETRVTDASRVPENDASYATWSPDDSQILFSVSDECGGRCRSLAVIDVIGTGQRKTITKTFVERTGTGRSGRSVIVGAAGHGIWRN